jgi:GNAT superfamily N-acetyltransferase
MSENPLALASVRRSNQVYSEQVGRRRLLDCGCAYYNRDYPRVPLCNFVGEVVLDVAGGDPWRQVEDFYGEQNLTCFCWVPALDQPPEPLGALLAPHGFERREKIALILRPDVAGAYDERFRILSARAMRRAYTAVLEERSREVAGLADDLAAVHLERLNDPQYDGFVALLDDEPVGIVSVFQVGEIGRICDLYAAPARRQQGVGTALFNHAVLTARRWALRPICAQVAAENVIGRALLAKAGFEEGGTIVSFCRRGVPQMPES